MSPNETATQLLTLLSSHGQGDYIGEPISQLAHSLQCAHFAAQQSSDPEFIVAALLHDIGQFLPVSDVQSIAGSVQSMSGNVGRVGHETIGAEYLRRLGFSKRVTELVAAHVPAKRFLCATEKAYSEGLSEASMASLKFQGGPMSESEVEEWKGGEWWEDKCRLRKCDDCAKVVGLEVGGLETYRERIERCLGA
ncbi:hypothetical protein K432DRAFT_386748 [Lepidopterella palustris CBS 459.81]|uniref:HD domain-containing protein n=1 Tax=Lepidopterella palustris CBS 459.81 TaxID=1314670 RepID=A0A8E2DZC8_9PEZI|nr:hypothetical protein K432DRAFT_386748 [Lepidopterella palustris CBS 459.81]